MTKTLVAVAFAAMVAGVAPAAFGEEPAEALDELDLVKLLNVEVSTATKTEETIDEAPAVITVVTRADIRRWGYRSVAEVLAHVAGLYVLDDHVLPNVAVRGMTGGLGAESGDIKVMIDGRSVAYRPTSGNWLGVELVPLESVAQIEIIRGPASALYGADAFLGVVNIITVRPDDLGRVRGRFTFGATGTNPGGQVDVAGGQKIGKLFFEAGVAGELTDRSGLELPDSPALVLPDDVGARRTALNLRRRSLGLQAQLGYVDEARGHVIASAYLSAFERGGDLAYLAQLTNETTNEGYAAGTVVSRGQLRLNIDGLVHATRTLDVALVATLFTGRVLAADRVDLAQDFFYFRRPASYRGFDTTAEVRWRPASRFNLIVGTEAIVDQEHLIPFEQIARATGQVTARADGSDRWIALVNVGTYASANLKVLDPGLKLTGGLRYDHHGVYGSQLNGRVGLTSRLGRSLGAKLLYGSAFKAPSPYLLYATPVGPGDVVGNPALRPQRIQTVETQISWKGSKWLSLTSGVSYNWLFDQAQFRYQGINQSAWNVASQRTLAWETRVDVHHHEDVRAYAGFDLVHSRRSLDQEGYVASLVGAKNVVYPPWIVRAGLNVALPSPIDFPLSAGAEGLFVGPRRAAEASLVARGADFYLPAYVLLDAFLTTRDLYLIRGQETRIALRGRNLLATRGPDPGFSGFEIPLGPREVFLELHHTF